MERTIGGLIKRCKRGKNLKLQSLHGRLDIFIGDIIDKNT